jgi:hypothetical protein
VILGTAEPLFTGAFDISSDGLLFAFSREREGTGDVWVLEASKSSF